MKASSDAVDRLITVPLTVDQRAALVDFVYNAGITNFTNSTLFKLLNAGHYEEIPAQLQKWAIRNGIASPGLEQRRKREAEIWNSAKAKQP
jgi:lysozyme